MRKLSLRLEADVSWPENREESLRAWENPTLPSGYTYLAQFVGHDLVHTATPFSTAPVPAVMGANLRRAGLDLETLYGDGPLATRHAYEPVGLGETERVRLRLGRLQRDDRTRDAQCPHRDIARASGAEAGPACEGLALTEPLLADPRNDAHAILSQLTALFSLLHNVVVDRLEATAQPTSQGASARAHWVFAAARARTTRAFRNVVRRDLLRRLLDPRVYEAYDGGFLLADAPAAEAPWSAPLEFSQGAVRFGHAMVRDEYRVNDGTTHDLIDNLVKTSLADPRNMPLNESWIVQWSHFFAIEGSRPNLAKRIGPNYSSGLFSQQIFPAIDAGGRVGLAYRDLLSSSFARLWSVRALIEEIRQRRPDLVRASRLMDDPVWRTGELAAWLKERRAFGGLDADDIETLANDPPLSFYTQWEAMREADGLRLGVLGSIILAETAFGAMARPIEGEGADFASASIADADPLLASLAEARTMSDLILFVRDAGGLARSVPAFA
jgi:hypothetical protein